MTSSIPLSLTGFAVFAGLAGALVPFQAGANATLGRALGHPLWATAASLLVSLLALAPVMFALRAPAPQLALQQVPCWAWAGGVAGVIYISAALLLTPSMGATRFIACVIAGQVFASLLIDHFGLMGLAVKPVNLGRVVGMALIIAGVVCVQYWGTTSQAPT